MTPTGHLGPDGLNQVLDGSPAGVRMADVLNHSQLAVGAKHSADFRQPLAGVFDTAENQTAYHGVEDPGPKGQGFHPGHHQWKVGKSAASITQNLKIPVKGDQSRVRQVVRQIAPRAAANLQSPLPDPGGKLAPPPRQAADIDYEHQGVVQPGDLLYSAHTLTSGIGPMRPVGSSFPQPLV